MIDFFSHRQINLCYIGSVSKPPESVNFNYMYIHIMSNLLCDLHVGTAENNRL
jgi:hypothetical protein